MAMTATSLNVEGTKAHALWFDNDESALRWSAPVPLDWVVGTDIALNMMCVQFNNPGTPTVVLRSSVQVKAPGEGTDWNIEEAVSCDQQLPQEVQVLVTRPISGAAIAHGEVIDWVLRRLGDNPADTVNDRVFCKMSAWIEYTATGDK